MMITPYRFNHRVLVEILVILLAAGVTYLPHLSQATIYRDDWYYVMDRLIGGPGVFEEMFSIDRPARGPLFEAYYQLFGIQPFPYHMSSFLWRTLGGIAALWLFRQLWPRQRLAVFWMALLYVLYPGYLRWMEGFENQPRILSSFLQVLSIALTLYALRAPRQIYKILASTGAILTGWAYIALVDFAFGMEIFRVLCIFLLINQQNKVQPLLQKGISMIRAWGITALVPFGFIFWRVFLFENERRQTDIGLQLGSLLSSPLLTGVWWLVRWFQSVVNVSILAWSGPLFQELFEIGLTDTLKGILIASSVTMFLLWISIYISKPEHNPVSDGNSPDLDWQTQAVWVGLAGTFMGLLPVIVANRYVFFGGYSHYSLPASLASVMAVVGFIFWIQSRNVRLVVIGVMLLLTVITHYTASLRVLREEQIIAAFWQQIAWRVPDIKPGTTLVVRYPSVNYAEDVDAVAGPANFIYFPEQTNQIPAVYPLAALAQMDYTTKSVLGSDERSYGYRTHIGEIDYEDMLVISQPANDVCVHVIDSRWPRYSERDSDAILLLGEYSGIENIRTDVRAPALAEFIFGPEPAHGWCYYYQQAELALQNKNWGEVAELGNYVTQANLTPNDRIEWAPFLQAYAVIGNEKAFRTTIARLGNSEFVRKQACLAVLKTQTQSNAFTPEIQFLIDEKLCRGYEIPTP